VVVMGEDALTALNDLDVPLARPLDYVPGARQQLTPSIDAIVTPNIDECLDEGPKRTEVLAGLDRSIRQLQGHLDNNCQ